MAQNSWFFNALPTGEYDEQGNVIYDRVYNADTYRKQFGAFVVNGVSRTTANDLRVTAAGGMALSVATGFAVVNGGGYENDTVYGGFTVPTAPTGDRSRIDRVVIRFDNTLAVRDIYLAYLTGEVAATPVAPSLTRTAAIYEIALADIAVAPTVTTITQANITDQRANTAVCGYAGANLTIEDWAALHDVEFNEWFTNVRDSLTSVTVEVRYTQRVVLESAANTVTITMPQYDSTLNQRLTIFNNGTLLLPYDSTTQTGHYNVAGAVVTFVNGLTAGSVVEISITIAKDGTGISSVVDDVTDLQNRVAALEQDIDGDFNYYCNGVNDNVLLSQIADAWLNGGTDYGSKKINVVGTVGVTAAYLGSGSTSNPYRWFMFGLNNATANRKLIVDFSNASQILIPVANTTYNYIFSGQDVHVIGANVVANNTTANVITVFDSIAGVIRAENCRFWVNGGGQCRIAQTGTFINCRGSVTTLTAAAVCFYCAYNSVLRIEGGEYYAYSPSTQTAAVLFGDSIGVAILYGVNCPSILRSGFTQNFAVNTTGGYVSITDTITTLPITASAANIRGTLQKNIPNRM